MTQEYFQQINESLLYQIPNLIRKLNEFQNKQKEMNQEELQKQSIVLRDEILTVLHLCKMIQEIDSMDFQQMMEQLNQYKLFEQLEILQQQFDNEQNK